MRLLYPLPVRIMLGIRWAHNKSIFDIGMPHYAVRLINRLNGTLLREHILLMLKNNDQTMTSWTHRAVYGPLASGKQIF